MSARFVNIDRDTPLLLPEDLRKWVPENHMVHFIIEALGKPDIRNFKVNEKGSGDEQYPPEMMPALLIYGYVTKRMSSRVLEEATCLNIGARYICGNKAHPGHRVLKRVGGVSVDGTKARAGKHSGVSYKRAVGMIAELEGEVEELIRKAEEADRVPLEAGLRIPKEIELTQQAAREIYTRDSYPMGRHEPIQRVE
jgi:transposase